MRCWSICYTFLCVQAGFECCKLIIESFGHTIAEFCIMFFDAFDFFCRLDWISTQRNAIQFFNILIRQTFSPWTSRYNCNYFYSTSYIYLFFFLQNHPHKITFMMILGFKIFIIISINLITITIRIGIFSRFRLKIFIIKY